MTQHMWTVGSAQAGKRLDQCVLEELRFRYSRTQIQRWLTAGCVQVNGRITLAHRRVTAGDTVVVDMAKAQALQPVRTLTPEPIPLDVVHEDADLLVVNKPAGLVTHPAPGHWSGTLVNAMLWHLQKSMGSDPQLWSDPISMRPGIVHRLDKDTSGLLIIAKTDRAHHALAKQLKARRIQRTYLACVAGLLEHDEGTINVPVGRHLTDRKRMSVRHLGGKPAVTHYRVIRRVRSSTAGPYTVIECRLETGRTHQIRLHLAHLGHPVLGDATYGTRPQAAQFSRHLLHAARLACEHPVSGERLMLEAPVPADMVSWVEPKEAS